MTGKALYSPSMTDVMRPTSSGLHRTAIRRGALSRPVQLALDSDVLTSGSTFFDYGCGRGEDIVGLRRLHFDADGWDPVSRPDGVRRNADVVNLGYVVNVVEDPRERTDVLRRAWGLAASVLVVSARLKHERRYIAVPRDHGDGILTGNDTFQVFFDQQGLRSWIQKTLSVEPVAAAPGVFFVFRDEAQASAFVVRSRRGRGVVVRVSRADLLYEAHREILDELIAFRGERGRLPRGGERRELQERLRAELRGVGRAWSVAARVTPEIDWERVDLERRDDTLVGLALLRLERRPQFTSLSSEIQHDVKHFFGSYRSACEQADGLLFAAGDLQRVGAAADASTIGKRLPTDLYVHESGVGLLPPVLRVYEGCARWLAGEVDADLVKLATDKPKVSYLLYPGFEKDPHPVLRRSLYVRLAALHVGVRDYSATENPPILHRKEAFLAPDHPLRERFARLTAQEERWGLLDEVRTIGTRDGWQERLEASGAALKGHRLVRR